MCDNVSIEFQQKTTSKKSTTYALGPQKSVYFVWDELLKPQNRVFLWRIGQAYDEKLSQLDINKSYKSNLTIILKNNDDTLDDEHHGKFKD